MATKVWIGGAVAVAQVNTATPANVEIGDVFTLTLAGRSISYTAQAATVADVTAGIAAAWPGSGVYYEWDDLTVTDSTTHVTIEAQTAGLPFTITSSTTDGGGNNTQTFVVAITTPSAGPDHWDTADNWSGRVAPAGADDLIVEHTDDDIRYGLACSSYTPTSLTFRSFTGTVGLPELHTAASTENGDYAEYRPTYLELGGLTYLTVDENSTPNRLNINCTTGSSNVYIHNSGVSIENGIEPIMWKGTHVANVVNVTKGNVGIAVLGGETAVVATLRVGYRDSVDGDAVVRCGTGVTLTTISKTGGDLTINSNATTITQYDGELTVGGSATVTTLNNEDGTCHYNSDGTMTTANIHGGSLDFRGDMRSRTVTNCTVYRAAEIHDPGKTVTWTNGIDVSGCDLTDVTLEVGSHYTVSLSAI